MLKDAAARLGITIDQIRKTTQSGRVSPTKNTERYPKFTSSRTDELVKMVLVLEYLLE